ncbi:hypothetical protein RSAG8_11784, partial [Rhizoctonia solani AG-8 WAC10335]
MTSSIPTTLVYSKNKLSHQSQTTASRGHDIIVSNSVALTSLCDHLPHTNKARSTIYPASWPPPTRYRSVDFLLPHTTYQPELCHRSYCFKIYNDGKISAGSWRKLP